MQVAAILDHVDFVRYLETVLQGLVAKVRYESASVYCQSTKKSFCPWQHMWYRITELHLLYCALRLFVAKVYLTLCTLCILNSFPCFFVYIQRWEWK